MKKNSSHKFDTLLNLDAYKFNRAYNEFTPHFHNYYVIGYMEYGQRTLYYQNKLYEINAGNFFLVNPHDTHSCNYQLKNPMEYFSLTLPQDFIKIDTLSPFLKSKIPKFSSPIITDKHLLHLFSDLYQSIFSNKPDSELKHARFNSLKDYLQDTHVKNFSPKPINVYDISYKLFIIVDYFKKNSTNKIFLSDICEQFALKPTTFFCNFEKFFGVSPKRYILIERINKAKQLLREGYSISQVATVVGFSDHSHFTHNFRKIEGITPTEYSKSFFEQK